MSRDNTLDSRTLRSLDRRFSHIKPAAGEIPVLRGIDIAGRILPRNQRMGGDHIIYLDFQKRYDLEARINKVQNKWQQAAKQFSARDISSYPFLLERLESKDTIIANLERCRSKGGILLVDVKGHDTSAAFVAAMFHQAFLTGVLYEMDRHGEITTHLFEILNTRIYASSGFDDFLTMIYGEIHEDGTFEFLSAGHPKPVVFSRKYNELRYIPDDMIIQYPPMGVMPSKADIDKTVIKSILGYKELYTSTEINLMGQGDILLLYSDGLMDHRDAAGRPFFPMGVEACLRDNSALPSQEIASRLKQSILAGKAQLEDDISFVIIKKHWAHHGS